jgi:hypothetical protein
MKYPAQQFDQLIKGLQDLKQVIDLNSMYPCALHFEVFQQGSKGHSHNWIYTKDGVSSRAHKIDNLEGWNKVVQSIPETFELYPDGCNDPHIETAVKKAIKQLTL